MECSCRLWPTPGMYAVTSTPPVSRTRQTLRSAEFGFLGVVVYTRVQTPRRCGEPFSAGVLVLSRLVLRPLRTSCAMVGILLLFLHALSGARSGRPSPAPAARSPTPVVPAARPGTTDPGVRSAARLEIDGLLGLGWGRRPLAGAPRCCGTGLAAWPVSDAVAVRDPPVGTFI